MTEPANVPVHRRAPRGAVFWLLSGQLIMFTGIAALFPIAPLYVAHRGGNSIAIAAFVAGPLIANTLVQVPAGHLADRFGRRPLLIWTRVAYVALSLVLFLDVGPLWVLILVRTLEGAASGAYVPALLATLTDLTEPGRRTERFAQQQASETAGLVVGPLLGGLIALWRDSGAFGISGLFVLIGLIPMLRVPETMAHRPRTAAAAPRFRWRRRSIVVPSLGLFAVGTLYAMYDVVWPQYLGARGYGAFVVGLTISLFALPILFLARPAGRLADRTDLRRLVPSSFLVVAACCAGYPFLRTLVPILLVGEVEAAGIVFAEPSLYAAIGTSAAEHERGRALGVGGSFQFAGTGFGAAVLGSLYGVNTGVPFWGGASFMVAGAVVCALGLPRRATVGPAGIVPPPPTVREREIV
ncbi:MAG: MFS transporter [Candidatus Dormibacteraeota bacterium]|nr:MFS transporter [Candidatus Dormibacteraeota bacterium]